MRRLLIFPAALLALASCKQNAQTPAESPLNGSWKLVSSKSIVKKDTTDTSPKKGMETIKLYNDDHFAFFTHNTMKMDTPVFISGAGTYTLNNENYTEHLKYCSAREWENHDFNFTMTLKGDTMQQRGVEKIDSLHIDHIIIETYAKIKQ
jgi:hypothetical protein